MLRLNNRFARTLKSIVFGFLLILGLQCVAAKALAATYFVRTDGGNTVQCTGTTNAAYPGSGNGRSCAWDTPLRALPAGYPNDGAPPIRLHDGDTLVIGSGAYQLGYGAPGAEACRPQYAYACDLQQQMPNHVTIKGSNCSDPPVLWGSGHTYDLIDLSGTEGVTVSCLELTDHSMCIDGYRPTTNTGGVTACKKSDPSEASAQNGIYIKGAANITLTHLNIHGFSTFGILAGRLSGLTTITDVTIRANGWGGWSGDLGGNNHESSNSGKLVFTDFKVLWNGCTEAYPIMAVVGCWGQNEGGYGDGFGSAWTGGVWVFKNSEFKHNTQDGLDLLYANGTGSVTIDHVVAWDNGGNGIKTAGPATLSNSVVNGYCNNWKGFPIAGDDSSGVSGTMCRADGTAVVMEFAKASGETVALSNNTITGNGDTLFLGGGSDAGVSPTSSDIVRMVNNIWLGQASAIPRNGGRPTALDWYSDGQYAGSVEHTNNIIWNVKHNFCPAGNICRDPKLRNQTLAHFDPRPLPGSPALRTAGRPSIGAIQ